MMESFPTLAPPPPRSAYLHIRRRLLAGRLPFRRSPVLDASSKGLVVRPPHLIIWWAGNDIRTAIALLVQEQQEQKLLFGRINLKRAKSR